MRGEGLSGSQGFQEFPTTTTGRVETTRYCIVLTFDCFALSAGCCIDKTHRCSHGQAMHASSPSTIQFFSLLPSCCVNINSVPALAIINKYEDGWVLPGDNWMDWQEDPAPVCVHAPDKAAATLPASNTSTVQTKNLNPPLILCQFHLFHLYHNLVTHQHVTCRCGH